MPIYVPPVITANIIRFANRMWLSVFYVSLNKQKLFTYTEFTDFFFITETVSFLRDTNELEFETKFWLHLVSNGSRIRKPQWQLIYS